MPLSTTVGVTFDDTLSISETVSLKTTIKKVILYKSVIHLYLNYKYLAAVTHKKQEYNNMSKDQSTSSHVFFCVVINVIHEIII